MVDRSVKFVLSSCPSGFSPRYFDGFAWRWDGEDKIHRCFFAYFVFSGKYFVVCKYAMTFEVMQPFSKALDDMKLKRLIKLFENERLKHVCNSRVISLQPLGDWSIDLPAFGHYERCVGDSADLYWQPYGFCSVTCSRAKSVDFPALSFSYFCKHFNRPDFVDDGKTHHEQLFLF